MSQSFKMLAINAAFKRAEAPTGGGRGVREGLTTDRPSAIKLIVQHDL